MDNTPNNTPVSNQVPQGAAAPPAQAAMAPQTPVATAGAPESKRMKLTRFAWVGILGIVIGGIFLAVSLRVKTENAEPGKKLDQTQQTATIVPTMTPVQHLSAIATSSGFLTFTQDVASLSATVNAFTLQDGAFTPPGLDLDIGFSTQ